MQITITTAGRNALVNAQHNGTLPVLVSQVGVTPQAFTPDASLVSLPGEIKRLATFAGEVVANDTIHVTIRDDSADTYSMGGFGLYLSDGTLFAVYGQADVILQKSAQAMMLLAADVRFVQIDATSLTFGSADFINPPATETVQGVVELATNDEASAGTDTKRAVTPAGIKYAVDQRLGAGAPSAFVKGLLGLATDALFRTALAIKSAALRDEGAGNGLDADKLDGQEGAYYRSFGNLTNLPSVFPGDWGSISNKPSTFPSDWSTTASKPSTFPSDWSTTANKPSTFPGDWSTTASKPSTFPGDWNTTANKPQYFPANYAALANLPTFKAAVVVPSSNQAIANDLSSVVVNFGTVVYDTAGIHNASLPDRLIVPSGASYVRISCQVTSAAQIFPTGSCLVGMFVTKNGGNAYSNSNGILFDRVDLTSGMMAEPVLSVVSAPIRVVAGDYFQIAISQNAGFTMSAGFSWASLEVVA